MDRVALVRSLHHPMRNHNSAAAEVLTGRTPAGGDQELLTDDPRGIPTLGSAVSFALGSRASALPYVALPYTIYNVVQLPGQTPGLARRRVRPLPGDRRSERTRLPHRGLRRRRPTSTTAQRFCAGSTARSFPGRSRRPRSTAIAPCGCSRTPRCADCSTSRRNRERVRDRYGRHLLGQSLLLARRLVEGGVNFVTVLRRRAERPGRELGQPREALPAAPPADPAGRRGALGADRGPGGARAARHDAGGGDGRVRPHAEDQRQPRAATTGRTATPRCWPAAG